MNGVRWLVLFCFVIAAKGQSGTGENSLPAQRIVEVALQRLTDGNAQKTRFTRFDQAHLVNHNHRGKLTADITELFEDTWINNLQYERLVERDGMPLSKKELAVEAARYEEAIHNHKRLDPSERAAIEGRRFGAMKLQTEHIGGPQYILQEAGRETMDGRSTRVVLATPVPPAKPEPLAPQQRFKLWIADEEEPYIVRLDFEFLADEVNFNQGTHGEMHYQIFDGVPVLSWKVAHSYMPVNGEVVTVDTEHRYSRYRRFATFVSILPAGPVEPGPRLIFPLP